MVSSGALNMLRCPQQPHQNVLATPCTVLVLWYCRRECPVWGAVMRMEYPQTHSSSAVFVMFLPGPESKNGQSYQESDPAFIGPLQSRMLWARTVKFCSWAATTWNQVSLLNRSFLWFDLMLYVTTFSLSKRKFNYISSFAVFIGH